MSYHCTTGDVHAKFNYALPNPSGQSLYLTQPNPESLNFRLNLILDPRNVVVQDIRGRENDFTLDVNGFEYLTRPTNETFVDKQSIETSYYEEIRQLVEAHTGADRVFVITHRIRQSYESYDQPEGDFGRERTPSRSVHVDRTPESVAAEVRKYMGDDAERLLQGRVRFINVWRPIGHQVHHEPLGFADWQTSSDVSNLLPLRVDNIYANFDVFISRFSRGHRWYYLGHQRSPPVNPPIYHGIPSHKAVLAGALHMDQYSDLASAPLIDFGHDLARDCPDVDTDDQQSLGAQEPTTQRGSSLYALETPATSTFHPVRSVRELIESLGSPIHSNTGASPPTSRRASTTPGPSASPSPPSPSPFDDPASFEEPDDSSDFRASDTASFLRLDQESTSRDSIDFVPSLDLPGIDPVPPIELIPEINPIPVNPIPVIDPIPTINPIPTIDPTSAINQTEHERTYQRDDTGYLELPFHDSRLSSSSIRAQPGHSNYRPVVPSIGPDTLLPTQTPSDVLLPSPLYQFEFGEKELVPGPVGLGMNSSVWKTDIRVSMFSLLELAGNQSGFKVEVVVRVVEREKVNVPSTSAEAGVCPETGACAGTSARVEASGTGSIPDDASDWQFVDD
ncbi:hypothetical protein FRC11_006558 [Ceratobasidium sp. 423]|nr:hypothetical protein FRC11_006558 [Ceratobasidium sp. 423]